MIRQLLARVGERPVFVVGKGGVGKTTTAGALALARVDRGHTVHLISTDPAHSLGDLFDQSLSDSRIEPCRCAPRLWLEELDAPGALARWKERVREPVRELLDRGTYLDDEDVDDFLERSLPGADEVMGALRLAGLGGEEGRHLVVDTAPTGHTLRLLDAGAVLEAWERALRAMVRKATVVASRLVRQPVRLRAEEFIDELATERRAFQALLRRAAFVLVSRPEALVLRETDRLLAALEARGLRLAAEVRIGEGARGREGELSVHGGGCPRGCEELRRWAAGHPPPGATPEGDVGLREPGHHRVPGPSEPRHHRLPGPGESPHLRSPGPRPAEPDLASLLRGPRDRLLFVGKGGVGKTTCATACAVALSRSLRVSLLGADPAGSLGDLVGRPVGREGVWIGERLLVRELEADRDFRELREKIGGEIEALAERLGFGDGAVLDRRVLSALLETAPPGLDELFGLAAVLEPGPVDVLVVDAAPTGHFLRFLETPQVALGWIHALLRLLLKYREAIGLGDLAERLLGSARRIRDLHGALSDGGRTGAVPVTLPEPLPVAETRRLCGALCRSGIAVAGVIWNRREVREPTPPAGEMALGCGDGHVPVLVAPPRDRIGGDLQDLEEFYRSWRRVA